MPSVEEKGMPRERIIGLLHRRSTKDREAGTDQRIPPVRVLYPVLSATACMTVPVNAQVQVRVRYIPVP